MTMLWVQNIWVTAICIPYLIFIEDKPKLPPSLVALEKPKEAPFCENISAALRLSEYRKLIGAFMLMQGCFLAFGTNINQLFTPVGFTAVDISVLGAGVILIGVVASMVAGVILNKTHKYLLMIRISAAGASILVGLALISFTTHNVDLISANMIAGACFLVPVIPVSIDFSAELTFPQEETVTTGFLLMSAQAFGFFFSIIVLMLCEHVAAIAGVASIVLCSCVATIICIFIKEDLRRIKFISKPFQLN